MNQKIGRGLAVGAALIVLLVVLYIFSMGSPPKTGPSSDTAPGAPIATAPARPEPPAAPAPTPPAPPI
jgi:hypothetical protein